MYGELFIGPDIHISSGFMPKQSEVSYSELPLLQNSKLQSKDISGMRSEQMRQTAAVIDVPGPHELSYDPVLRYRQLAWAFREPRGTKSVEHMAALRQSDPSLGSLAPRVDRPAAHELTYDPVLRYRQLARSLRQPRGAKSVAHLAALRQSDPAYGTLYPRRLLALAQLGTQLGALASLRRVASTASFYDDDEVHELPSLRLSARLSARSSRGGRWERCGGERWGGDDASSDDESERSAARTVERCSNDTVSSYLLDEGRGSHDTTASDLDEETYDGCGLPRKHSAEPPLWTPDHLNLSLGRPAPRDRRAWSVGK